MTEPPVAKVSRVNPGTLAAAALLLCAIALVMQMRHEQAMRRELQLLRNEMYGLGGNRANGSAYVPQPAPEPQDRTVHMPRVADPPPGAVVQEDE